MGGQTGEDSGETLTPNSNKTLHLQAFYMEARVGIGQFTPLLHSKYS
jgi:hypothetical protein